MRLPLVLPVTLAFLLVTVHRLPAPIQEVKESPTPTPEIPASIAPLATTSASSSSSSDWPGEIFPETRSRRLTAKDIYTWDADKLRYAINEMYARGGYDFRSAEIKQVFMRFPWYRERLVNGRTQDEAYLHLSTIERSNLELLQATRRGK